MNTKKISSVEAPEYRLFLDNYNKLRKTVGNMKSRKQAIDNIFDQLDMKIRGQKKQTKST